MNTKPYLAHAVYETLDEYGRSRRGRLVGVYNKYTDAAKAAKNRGAWGGIGAIEDVYVLEYEKGYAHLLVQEQPVALDADLIAVEALKRSLALAKLTAEDRLILGIKI